MKTNQSYFSVGPDTYKVPMSMHRGARQRLVERLRQHGAPAGSVVLLQGGVQQTRYDSDTDILFQQESFFQYLFGVRESGFYGAVEVDSGRTTLFMPRLPELWAVWLGKIEPPEYYLETYGVDAVGYTDELAAVLKAMKPSSLLLLRGKNSDSGQYVHPTRFNGLDKFRTDTSLLYTEIVECRLIKFEEEAKLLRYINAVSSAAHLAAMRRVKPGLTEYQIEATFLHEIYDKGGCRFVGYPPICGGGQHSATLHYYGQLGAPEDTTLKSGGLFLNDSGARYHGYVADVTCTYPVNGKFSDDQRAIYEAVLAANRAVQKAMKPGVPWPDMHRLAERVIAQHLLDIGIVRGSLDGLLANHIPALFMPHGVGHLLGLDTHDVGGYPKGIKRIDEPGIRHLRCGRPLEAGMFITVEPGIYFIDSLLDQALADPIPAQFLNGPVLKRFRKFGGVRIEDNVLVTPAGSENLTTVPREVSDIEAVMAAA